MTDLSMIDLSTEPNYPNKGEIIASFAVTSSLNGTLRLLSVSKASSLLLTEACGVQFMQRIYAYCCCYVSIKVVSVD